MMKSSVSEKNEEKEKGGGQPYPAQRKHYKTIRASS